MSYQVGWQDYLTGPTWHSLQGFAKDQVYRTSAPYLTALKEEFQYQSELFDNILLTTLDKFKNAIEFFDFKNLVAI